MRRTITAILIAITAGCDPAPELGAVELQELEPGPVLATPAVLECEAAGTYADACDPLHACNVAEALTCMEAVEARAVCRAGCMRTHLECLLADPDVCGTCEHDAAECVSACGFGTPEECPP